MRTLNSILLGAGSVLALALPLASHAAETGQFVKGSGDTIYWLGADNKRYVFPDDVTLQSWISEDTSGQVLDDGQLAVHPIGGAMTVRPGSYLVRFASSPTIYVVAHGAMLHAVSDDLAAAYGGTDWKLKIQTLDVALFANYRVGQPLKYSSDFNPEQEANLAATPDAEITNKLAAGSLTKSPSPFRGTVSFVEDPSSSSTTKVYVATVSGSNAPVNNLRIDLYAADGTYQISCLGTDRCKLVLDTTAVTKEEKLRYYAVASNERGETLERAYSPDIIVTPQNELPQM